MNIATSIHAKAMLFAISIPGWGSLDAVRQIHSRFELASIIFFGFLALADILEHVAKDNNRKTLIEKIGLFFFALAVIAEGVGYEYGQRNDELSQQVIGSLDTKAKEASSNASRALTDSGTALGQAKDAENKSGSAVVTANKANTASGDAQKKVEEAKKEADIVEYVVSARHVQDVNGLKEDLEREFKGKSIIFKSYAAAQDTESFWLCAQLADIAQKAGVNSTDECATEPLPRLPVTDLLISAPTHDEAFRLSWLLKKPRRVSGYAVGENEAPRLTVLVGVKESLPLWPKSPDDRKGATKTANHRP